MSYFPKMFISPSCGFRQYLLNVGPDGAIVVYGLEDGKPVSMAAGKPEDVILPPLREADPRCRIVRWGPRPGEIPSPTSWGLWESGMPNRWRGLVRVVNRNGIVGARVMGKVRKIIRAGYTIPEFTGGIDPHKKPPHEVTDLGARADARMDEDEK